MNLFSSSQACACNDDCCQANNLCSFSGNLDDVCATPIYVQSVYDAVRFHLQGMKSPEGPFLGLPWTSAVYMYPDFSRGGMLRLSNSAGHKSALFFGKKSLHIFRLLSELHFRGGLCALCSLEIAFLFEIEH